MKQSYESWLGEVAALLGVSQDWLEDHLQDEPYDMWACEGVSPEAYVQQVLGEYGPVKTWTKEL